MEHAQEMKTEATLLDDSTVGRLDEDHENVFPSRCV
jgi:hypothetical protein